VGFEYVDRCSDLAEQSPEQSPAIIYWFEYWLMNFSSEHLDAAVAGRGIVMATWEPRGWNGPVKQPKYALQIIQGTYDSYIRKWAQAVVAWQKPFFLRFAPEIGGDWRPWCPGVNGNTTLQFISTRTRVHGIFSQERATDAKWVWCPIVYCEGSTPFKAVSPCGDHLDWVRIDGYNQRNTQSWSRWHRFTEMFGKTYRALKNMTSKPVMTAKMASTEHGGDKAG
jgi:hypothetical protein